ncbi:MAG: NAD(P)H-binding protein [Azospirillum sp.]|nr:NAD(P)H-binding protein [Azospirillum sp.]
MRVMVVGAGGFIGRHLVRGLAAAGHQAVCCGRSTARLAALFPGADCVPGDYTRDRADDWLPRLTGIDAVINAVGIIAETTVSRFDTVHVDGPCTLFDACRRAGVGRVIQISALGADDTAASRYHLSKRAADRFLLGLEPGQTGLRATVLRPSVVIGPGGASTALFAALAAFPLPLRLGRGRWQLQPIAVDDVVATVVGLLDPDWRGPTVLDLVGPEAVTTDRLTACFRSWLGFAPAPFLPIPEAVLRLAARLGDLVGAGPLRTESLAMLVHGNVAEVEPMIAATGRRPASIAAALAGRPAGEAERWHAGLAFVKLPLRLSLALLWIASGVVSLGLWPTTDSLDLLARVGLTGSPAWATLIGASLLDILVGIALLLGWRPVLVGTVQLVMLAGVSLIILIGLPEFWLHPFGPVIKNLPIGIAILVMMALEARPKWI